eukprot:3747263-Lingulodinium_polyedra.AAC.1
MIATTTSEMTKTRFIGRVAVRSWSWRPALQAHWLMVGAGQRSPVRPSSACGLSAEWRACVAGE